MSFILLTAPSLEVLWTTKSVEPKLSLEETYSQDWSNVVVEPIRTWLQLLLLSVDALVKVKFLIIRNKVPVCSVKLFYLRISDVDLQNGSRISGVVEGPECPYRCSTNFEFVRIQNDVLVVLSTLVNLLNPNSTIF